MGNYFTMARTAIILLFLGLQYVSSQDNNGTTLAPGRKRGSQQLISLYEVKVDLCYHWKTGNWPFWVHETQIPLREKYEKRYFYKDGKRLCNEDIWEFCKKYKFVILDPYFNNIHYELCWYAKYGSWKYNPIDEEEEAARRKLLEKCLYRDGRQISQREVQRLCPNYYSMNCPPCTKLTDEMCHYARHGKWSKNAPSTKEMRRFFYLGVRRIEVLEILRKCHHIFDGSCKRIYYPDCF